MSFTTIIKNEIAKQQNSTSENIAELSAFFRNNATFDSKQITLLTENAEIAKRIYLLLKELYDIPMSIEKKESSHFHHKNIYQLQIKEKVAFLLQNLNVLDDNQNRLPTPEDYVVGANEEIRAYLRGVFLCQGSINDPKTSRYHMELLIGKPREAVFVQKLLNIFDLNAKLLTRDKGYMIYLKEADKISDFLKLIKAYNAVMYFEDVRIYRDQKNQTNRLNNCEQANMDKVIQNSQEQLRHISILQEHLGIALLDDKTKEALEYRLKYKEASLQELSQIISVETGKKITKSGLNHRFRKIKELALKLEENKEE